MNPPNSQMYDHGSRAKVTKVYSEQTWKDSWGHSLVTFSIVCYRNFVITYFDTFRLVWEPQNCITTFCG